MKLTGKKKAEFLKRMAKGRAAKSRKSAGPKRSKSAPKRTKSAPKKPKSAKVKTKSKPRKTMAKRKRFTRARKTGGKILGNSTLRIVMIGVGASTVAGTVVGMVAPQFVPIAKPWTAFLVGGPIGAISSIMLSGDGLGALGGIFGGASTPQQEFGV